MELKILHSFYALAGLLLVINGFIVDGWWGWIYSGVGGFAFGFALSKIFNGKNKNVPKEL